MNKIEYRGKKYDSIEDVYKSIGIPPRYIRIVKNPLDKETIRGLFRSRDFFIYYDGVEYKTLDDVINKFGFSKTLYKKAFSTVDTRVEAVDLCRQYAESHVEIQRKKNEARERRRKEIEENKRIAEENRRTSEENKRILEERRVRIRKQEIQNKIESGECYVIYNGVEYKTKEDVLDILCIKEDDLDFGLSLGLNKIEALDYCTRVKGDRCFIKGKWYSNLEKACEAYNISYGKLKDRGELTGESLEDILNKLIDKQNLKAIDSADLEYLVSCKGMSRDKAVEKLASIKRISFNNEIYNTRRSAASHYDIKLESVYKRMKAYGEDFEQALNMLIMIKGNVIMDDMIFVDAYEAAKFYKLDLGILSKCVSRQGIEYYEAIRLLKEK